MNKILPFEEKAIITSYPHYSFMCSMIQTKENGLEWIYQAYIQLRSIDIRGTEKFSRDSRLSFYPGAGATEGDLWDLCPFIDKFVIPRHLLLKSRTSHTEFIKGLIDKDLYAMLYIDQFFIEDVRQMDVFYHPLFIYGYDDDKQVFHCADCFENLKYGVKEVSYKCFEMASRKFYSNDLMNGIVCFKLKDYVSSGFSIDFVKKQLSDYLDSGANQIDYYNKIKMPTGVRIIGDTEWRDAFGIKAYDQIKLILEDILFSKYPWNAKIILAPDLRLVVDHSLLNLRRYSFIVEKYGLTENEKLVKDMENQFAKARIIENLLLKYSLSPDLDYVSKMLSKINKFVEDEKEITAQLLKELEGLHD